MMCFEKHIFISQNGPIDSYVRFEPKETKNSGELILPLVPKSVLLIRKYEEEILSRIKDRGDAYALFPSARGRKSGNHLGQLIANRLKSVLGMRINPHFFRHLAAHCYLVQHPGDYDSVSKILGQNDVNTTRKYYCGEEGQAAIRHVAACLEGLSDGTGLLTATYNRFTNRAA